MLAAGRFSANAAARQGCGMLMSTPPTAADSPALPAGDVGPSGASVKLGAARAGPARRITQQAIVVDLCKAVQEQ